MVGLDLVIVVFCAFLVAKGIWKGFVKEMAGIVAVIGGVVVSFLFHAQVQPYIVSFVGEKYVQFVSYILVFIGFYLIVLFVTFQKYKCKLIVLVAHLDQNLFRKIDMQYLLS